MLMYNLENKKAKNVNKPKTKIVIPINQRDKTYSLYIKKYTDNPIVNNPAKKSRRNISKGNLFLIFMFFPPNVKIRSMKIYVYLSIALYHKNDKK